MKNKVLNKIIIFIITTFIISIAVLIFINFDAYYQIMMYKLNTDKVQLDQKNTYYSGIYIDNNTIQYDINTEFLDKDINTVMQDLNRHTPMPNDNRVIIPKINKNVPLIFIKDKIGNKSWNDTEEIMLDALKNGVVHYPGTALPGDIGNFVITGHSSYYPWDDGRYKSVFALLEEVNIGDEVIYIYNQKRYIYKITDKKIVLPENVHILSNNKKRETTIITCVPIGTNLKRLVLHGELIK